MDCYLIQTDFSTGNTNPHSFYMVKLAGTAKNLPVSCCGSKSFDKPKRLATYEGLYEVEPRQIRDVSPSGLSQTLDQTFDDLLSHLLSEEDQQEKHQIFVCDQIRPTIFRSSNFC